jgi:hypothetical protein
MEVSSGHGTGKIRAHDRMDARMEEIPIWEETRLLWELGVLVVVMMVVVVVEARLDRTLGVEERAGNHHACSHAASTDDDHGAEDSYLLVSDWVRSLAGLRLAVEAIEIRLFWLAAGMAFALFEGAAGLEVSGLGVAYCRMVGGDVCLHVDRAAGHETRLLSS